MVFGVSYRGLFTNSLGGSDAIIGMLGFHASQRLFVAYSYDYALSGLNNATSGSHELCIVYTFPVVMKFAVPDRATNKNPRIR